MSKPAGKGSAKRRLTGVLIAVGLLLLLCIGRAVFIVVENGSEYKHKALSQAAGSSKVILARPGNILDTNGLYLTSTRKVYRLILDPKVMAYNEEHFNGSLDQTVSILAEAFSLDRTDLKAAFLSDANSSYLRYTKAGVIEEEAYGHYLSLVEAFNEEKKAHNKTVSDTGEGEKISKKVAGVWFEEEYRRSYPFDSILSKTVGYTTADTTEGILGLEKTYNTEISGTNGREYTYVDDQGNAKKEVTEAQNGYTLYTSLDVNVAKILQDAIRDFSENDCGGKRINVLVMNPKNAEIIAIASDTDFDLNDPTDLSVLFSEEELAAPKETFLLQEAFRTRPSVLENMTDEEALVALLQQVQMNYPVSSTYEPGSTAKTFTLSAGIDSGLVNEDDTWICEGAIPVENYVIHCHAEDNCGELTPMEALGRSCNVCLVQMAEQIGKATFVKYQELFNLGQKTGVDLPGEANTAALIYSEHTLGRIELATNSFGQGFNVTMLQMAAAYSSVLNGGYYYEPHAVRRIADEDGNTVKEFEPELVRVTVSRETSEYMKNALSYVAMHGTAAGYLRHEGYNIGGKTGAAEKLPRGTGKYIVSFIGSAPLDDPRFLVYVLIDEPGEEDQSSSAPAQRLCSTIMKKLYSYYNVYMSTEADAYSYDWSRLHDYAGISDGANGEQNVDDPNHTIDWITDQDNMAESEGILPPEE